MKYFFIFTIAFLYFGKVNAGNKDLKLTLKDVEERSLSTSHTVKAVNAEAEAVKNKAEAQRSLFYPKITLDGGYRYISEVPTLSFPGGAKTAFGDNRNYSLGPALSWVIWDFGSISKSVKGLEAFEKSKEAEKNLINRQILLNARLAYFKVQLRMEQQRLVADSLNLAESQYRDIKNRVSAGSSNRIDLLSAHKEVLNLKIQSRQLQSDLASDLRDLYALVGSHDSSDYSISIGTDPIATSLAALSKYEGRNLDSSDLNQHPLTKLHAANAESFRLTAESFNANQLPKLSLFAKTSIDYPNGPILEQIHQNTIGVTLSMPLYEGGRSSNEAAEKQNLSIASENRREQARSDIVRDWQKANDQLKGLKDKAEIYGSSVNESVERAKLVYSSYRVGRSSFLEVQSANLQALEIKVQSTTNDVQILIQLAYLASITEEQ